MAEAKKPWTWRARIAAMPPIDWEALARDYDRRSYRRTPATIKRWQASWYRNKARRQRAAINATVERLRQANRRQHSVFTVAHRLTLAMDAAEWRTRVDIRRRSGVAKESAKLRLMTMLADGLIERRQRPDFGRVGSSAYAPRYEHRLTAAGAALRREAEWLA